MIEAAMNEEMGRLALRRLSIEAEAGIGEDRLLDTNVEMAFAPFLKTLPRTESGGWVHPEFGLIAPAARYTTSIDAVADLICARLPGWLWEVRNNGYAEIRPGVEPDGRWRNACNHSSPARGLLAAFLQAAAIP